MTTVPTRAMNLAHFLTQTARRFPDRDAVVHGELRWSWRELDTRVSLLAAELRRRGVGPGECVLLHSPNHPEYIQAMLAVWRVGAALAPTNFRLTAADVAVIAGVCRPVLALIHPSLVEQLPAIAAATELRAGTLLIGADGDGSVAALPADGPALGDQDVPVGQAAWYFFTSGTSGTPKAAVLTHEQMGFVTLNHLADLMPGTTEEHASLAVAPLSHGAGIHLLPQIARGARTVLPTAPGLDPAEVWELVERERVSNMFTVPTILTMLAEHPAAEARDHSSLRSVIYAGAPMAIADQERARGVLGDVLVQYYGLGEVTGAITVLPPREHGRPRPADVEIGSCGYPRTGIQVSIQDERGRELPPGERGEICVAGPAVCHGYLDNPAADAAAFRDGWFRTGDLGLLDESGYLYVTGRASDMYISGGSNVFPRDIEEKLLQHPAVHEVAVLGMPDAKWGEVGVAVCVPRAGRSLDHDELREFLRGKLAGYKMPRHFVVWDALPKSGYGKIVKRTLRTTLLDQGWPDSSPAGPGAAAPVAAEPRVAVPVPAATHGPAESGASDAAAGHGEAPCEPAVPVLGR
ncbi:AMP-binding protein [Nocardia sp. NPDC057353]|uniref:AMP-binding protein n=1 Tax=Nocardia sp. NPDC057353 TaxID=3346104 RepID=UPI003629C14A